jgi:hypothetical protein
MDKSKRVSQRAKRSDRAVHPDPRKPMPQIPPAGSSKNGRRRSQHFETFDSGLAAYLHCHGLEFIALGTGGELEPSPKLTFVFDASPARWYPAVKAYRTGRGDRVASASAFLAKWRDLETIRQDEELRLLRRVDDDLHKVRVQDDEDAK